MKYLGVIMTCPKIEVYRCFVNLKQILNTYYSLLDKVGKKKGPSVETERPLTIACHMKNSS